jgi:hypothetical protein
VSLTVQSFLFLSASLHMTKAPQGKKEDKDDKKGKPAPDEPKAPVKLSKRPYSIVVWGATGFTGALVCRQIAERYPVRQPSTLVPALALRRFKSRHQASCTMKSTAQTI